MAIPGGYVFRPSHYEPPIGHAGLDIELVEPRLPVAGCIRCATFLVAANRPAEHSFHDIHQEESVGESHAVCAGNFRLRAGNGDIIYGYSFGGRIDVHAEGDHTCCALASSAPIFDLAFGLSSTRVFLYSEVMAALARRRATFRDDQAFCRRLMAAEPFALFVAVMSALEEYLSRFNHSMVLDEYRKGARTVRRSIATLQAAGDWPLRPPRLEDIL